MSEATATTINAATDELIPVNEAFSHLPRKPSPNTIWRWLTIGIAGVKLQAVKIGHTWYTTAAAMNAFAQGSTAAKMAKFTPSAEPAAPQSRTRTKSTERRLREAGALVGSE